MILQHVTTRLTLIMNAFQSHILERERGERERDIKFIGLFRDRGHRGPYSPYKPCNHNLYIGIITHLRGKNIYRSDVLVTFEVCGHIRCLQVIYLKYNYIYWLLSHSVDFKTPQGLSNPRSKAVPGKFHRSGGHSKCNSLQAHANFQRSQANCPNFNIASLQSIS